MKNFHKIMLTILGLVFIIITVCFTILSEKDAKLNGTYRSKQENGNYTISLTVDSEENTFVLYIDQREVDKGTFLEETPELCKLKGTNQELEIRINSNKNLDIFIEKINGDSPINIKKFTDVKQYFSTVFGDENEYIKLISN